MKISRYREPTGPQAATQPGSQDRVLANRLGLTSKRAVDLAEALALARVQETYYARLTAETRFTAALIRQMHHDWLGDIYKWAGEYRQIELEKPAFGGRLRSALLKTCLTLSAVSYGDSRRANPLRWTRSP